MIADLLKVLRMHLFPSFLREQLSVCIWLFVCLCCKQVNTSLKKLWLSPNNVGAEGGVALAEALEVRAQHN